MVRLSILTNQIPRAQAVLRRRGCAEQRLPALRMEGLRQAFSCLQRRDLGTACRLLVSMVRTSPRPQQRRNVLSSSPHAGLDVSGFQREGAAPPHLPVHRRQRPPPLHGRYSLTFLRPLASTSGHLMAAAGFFQVKELLERGFLPDQEKQSVAFIGEMEKLGSLPPSRRTATGSQR